MLDKAKFSKHFESARLNRLRKNSVVTLVLKGHGFSRAD
jgi:hypothetical protein